MMVIPTAKLERWKARQLSSTPRSVETRWEWGGCLHLVQHCAPSWEAEELHSHDCCEGWPTAEVEVLSLKAELGPVDETLWGAYFGGKS